MLISLRWLNTLLEPANLTAAEADEALTSAGFPIESAEVLDNGDTRLDVEVTSNRGDVLSHVGAAREVAAVTGRRLKLPKWSEPTRSGEVSEALTLENTLPDLCPLFTAQVIRGVRVGPSPSWLVELLEAVGQRSINNVVDVTNLITYELGHPCHVFDLQKLEGATLEIRHAHEGETLTTLDGKLRKLMPTDVVVADAVRAQSLAGVMGGADSEVSESTTDVVFEMATWDPVAVRTAARRLAIRTDASHRFERGVSPEEIDRAAFRAMALLQEVAGGTVCEGMLEDGDEPDKRALITLRPERTNAILGIEVHSERQRELLERLEVDVMVDGAHLVCRPPAFRLDLTREIDLIEEIARLNGLEAIPLADRVGVVVQQPSATERALRDVCGLLTGMGFFETVTFSFASPDRASRWVGEGMRTLRVDDERRGSEPVLRPSVLSGLLACRRANQDAQAKIDGGMRLFEVASSFVEQDRTGRAHVETPTLALLMDTPAGKATEAAQLGVRYMRGVVEALVRQVKGSSTQVSVVPVAPPASAWGVGTVGRVEVNGMPVGVVGMLSEAMQRSEGLDQPVVLAELDLLALLSGYGTARGVTPLPQFPAMERDLTLDLPESVNWASVEGLVEELNLERLESIGLVGVYRGQQTGGGRKSVTARLVFRDSSRTLRREEVEPSIDRLVQTAAERIDAKVRQ